MIAKLLISPSLEARVEEISKILSQAELKNPHPDLLYFPSDSKLGIEQARKIKEYFSLKPYSAKGRAVILEDATELTIEAQNALLKTLEELSENAILILGANSDSKLLPTVLSRCQIIHLPLPLLDTSDIGYVDMPGFSADIEKLLDSTIEERFEYIEKLKNREEFFLSLLNYFHKEMPANSEFVSELLQAEEWQKQNVNIRAILEYLMLVMPKNL